MESAATNSTTAQKQETQIFTVEELNRQIRGLIEGQLPLVWVQGEISNFKAHPSGHFYFSLKDAKSQIAAVMFRGYNSRLKFKPTDGLEVVVRGRITVYEPRGNYQVLCEHMEPIGAGALQKAFEQLKEKLKAEGLFEASRKRPFPEFPKHIALVTSPTGAAIQDMLNILNRRNKWVQVTVVPTLVQGDAAVPQIVAALNSAYKLKDVDAIIVGRGGGSMEDLWCFNDERVARTIAASPVPIISAVGHEIDFTIADFVADLRAPTPSAAAELIVKNAADVMEQVQNRYRLLNSATQKILKLYKQKLIHIGSRLVDPRRRLLDYRLRNDELLNRLQSAQGHLLQSLRLRVQVRREGLTPPDLVISEFRRRIENGSLSLRRLVGENLAGYKEEVSRLSALLDGMSPLRVLERGYSVTKKGKSLIHSVDQVAVGDLLEVSLAKGRLQTRVEQKIN